MTQEERQAAQLVIDRERLVLSLRRALVTAELDLLEAVETLARVSSPEPVSEPVEA